MLRRSGKYFFLLPLIFILGLSYWRYTYILNPNTIGEPLLLDYRLYVNKLGANSLMNIRSIVLYWISFFIGNTVFFFTLESSLKTAKNIGFVFLIISMVSGMFFIIHGLWLQSPFIYSLGATIKNFVLSPVFTAVAYIMLKYFQNTPKAG
jgi:hypothetical protein